VTLRSRVALFACLLAAAGASPASAQAVAQRGFVEVRGTFFPQTAVNDPTRAVADVLAREEVFADLTPWLQGAVGVELRANSHDQVDTSWRLDVDDRGRFRPAISLRRFSVTAAHGPFTVDVGKQFIRWGTTDIVTPTDRFAPRDFLDVVNDEVLAIAAVRVVAARGADAVDVVWSPRFTPSRTPLLDQRWTVPAPGFEGLLHEVDRPLPVRDQFGVRWTHLGSGYEIAGTVFDGFNHLPDVEIVLDPTSVGIARRYPRLRVYGGDAAVPTRWFTLKGEAAYFTSPGVKSDEYVLYVVQLERQSGEWLLIGGYAGEVITEARTAVTFAPERGLTRSLVGRASYTIDVNRSVAMEGAVRQNGEGAYLKAEYSEAGGQHWRATLAGTIIRGEADDFLGQYRRNSHLAVTLRYSF
jgi:hypothetical protein